MTLMNRKTATKLLLINWSRFQYECVRLDGSTLFTGVNGSGKSTVLDAMTYLLTGNTQFNTAAKDRDRTVKAYVRGDTKANGESRYLRKDEVISYIAMEFYSPVEGENLVVGVGIESANENDSPNSNWFICKNARVEDIDFGKKSQTGMMVNPLARLSVCGHRMNRKDFLGRDKARDQILRALGMRCDATLYRKKLLKMMSFNPENDINKFIAECVLEADPIDSLAQLREQKELFEKVRAMYENLMECKRALETLEISTQGYEARQRNFRVRELMLQYQEVKVNEEEIAQARGNLEKVEAELHAVCEKQEEVEQDYENAKERMDAILNSSGFMDLKNTIEGLQRQEKELTVRLDAVEKQMEKLKKTENLISEELSFSLEKEEIKKTLTVLSKTEKTAEQKQGTFVEYVKYVENLQETLRREKYALEREEEETKHTLSETEQTIKKLEANILHLPREILETKKCLIQELEKEGIHTDVRTFAECVEKVTNEEYRIALETFLGRKRYHLIVDAKYCKKAMEIVEAQKLYYAGIVVTDKLLDTKIEEGSAAGLLTIHNVYARRYANYLLNKIHLCESVEELHEYPLGGLTKSGMLAKSYTVSLMNTKKTEICLGSNAIKLQMKMAQKRREQLQKALHENEEKSRGVKKKLQALHLLDTQVDNYRFDAPQTQIALLKQLKECREDMESYQNNPNFTQILAEQTKAKAQMEESEKKKVALYQKKGSLESSRERGKRDIESLTQKGNLAKDAYEEKKKENADLVLLAQEEYAKASASRKTTRVVGEKHIAGLKNEVEKAKEKMESDQLEYCRIAGMDNNRRGISYIPFYRQCYSDLSVVKIEEAKNKMQEQEQNLQSAFMHDFIGEINEAIRKAKDEIALINRELKQIPFGQDTYRFVMKEKADRGIFFKICKKLADYMNSPELYMTNNRNDEEMEHDIAQFMDTILEEEDETEYTDYRKYFHYDMEIIRSLGDKEITADLSKKQGSASNGEKQTPYFIILAASLMQCYPKNVCCARLAFIDEAFSALSRERIEKMVNYFEDNSFQVIYAAPPEKIASIGQYITTTVSLYPKGNYSYAIEGQYTGA